MEVKWLLQEGIFDENLEKMCKIIKEQGMSYQTFRYDISKPIIYYGLYDNDCVIFYGSLEMMKKIQREKKWVPGGWCNFKNFECTNYYPYLGDYLLNRDYIILPLYEVIKQKDFIKKIFNNDNIFIRSNNGTKEIEGQIIDIKNLSLESLNFQYHNNLSLLTIISSPKKIEKEWRLVIANKVITGSQYKINYELEVSKDCPQKVIDYGNKIYRNYEPDTIFTMDICQSNGKLYLLEINSFSCSGLYDCDLEIVVKEASQLAIQEWEIYNKIM